MSTDQTRARRSEGAAKALSLRAALVAVALVFGSLNGAVHFLLIGHDAGVEDGHVGLVHAPASESPDGATVESLACAFEIRPGEAHLHDESPPSAAHGCPADVVARDEVVALTETASAPSERAAVASGAVAPTTPVPRVPVWMIAPKTSPPTWS